MANHFAAARVTSITQWLDHLPLNTKIEPEHLWSHTFTIMPHDDPWDWDVERIVQELCTPDRSWTPRSTSAPQPDTTSLAQALRHHEIDGSVLLTDITDAELRIDLQLTKLAHKSFVRHAISELRLRSLQYSAYIEKHQPPHHLLSAEILHRDIQGLQEQFKSLHGSITGLSLTNSKPANPGFHALDCGNTHNEGPASKRQRLETDSCGNYFIEQAIDDLPWVVAAQDEPLPALDQGTSEKKRKRIAPTLISIETHPRESPGGNMLLDDAINSTLLNPGPAAVDSVPLGSDRANGSQEPGVAFVDNNGRKRLVPILQPEPLSSETLAHDDGFMRLELNINLEQAAPKVKSSATPNLREFVLANEYLGKKALPVDELFYSTSPGEEINGTESGSFYEQQEVSSGKRRYVHKMMKNFFRTEQRSFNKGDQSFVAIQPYSKDLTPRFRQPSITLYSVQNGQARACREHIGDWPELDTVATSQPMVDARTASFNPLGPDFNLGSSYDDWDPAALEKYNYLEGGNELLPLYGDSDSDNEYDDATWREIEIEQRGAIKREMRISKRPALDASDVIDAINDGKAQIVKIWKTKHLHKLERKAWRVWTRSRKNDTMLEQILAAQEDVKHLDLRLEALQNKILSSSWTSKLQVIKQTTSLEPTVFEREELLWMISTLQQKRQPKKPEMADLGKTSRKQSQRGDVDRVEDDGESLDSRSEAYSTEESLDDFIIEDEPTVEGEHNLQDDGAFILPAETEDEDTIMTDHHTSLSPKPELTGEKLFMPVKAAERRSFPTQILEQDGLGPRHVKSGATVRHPQSLNGHTDIIDLTLTSSDDTTPRKKLLQPITLTSPSHLTPIKPRFLHGTPYVDLATPPQGNTDFVEEFLATGTGAQNVRLSNIKKNSDAPTWEDSDDEPISSHRHHRTEHTSEDDVIVEENSPRRKKKKFVEDADAREMRQQDKIRRAEQDERRQMLYARLNQFGLGDDVNSQTIVNVGAAGTNFLLNDHIAQRVKPHQIEGIRFLWSSTITESKEPQGCLLAHTMGLGKTMQAISLLVSIAEAAASEDPSISTQIPERLRTSKTLVICPPGLIDNWMDELLTWVSPNDLLGDLRKIDASMRLRDRLHTISDWYRDGGVLVLGYEMFRDLVNNTKSQKRDAPLSEAQHERIMEELVRGPNIVIADEAHKMKSANTALSKAAVLFETKCRVALTGSPLANNIAEYHTMIDWVAPNYLGPAREFRAKFVDPIQQGLYEDSKAHEKRRALKMLSVLEMDIDPKVSRADMSVLKNELPIKTEFTITVPLTDLQRAAYCLYVRAMCTSSSVSLTKDGDIKTATLWQWLAMLSLLCNHPATFKAKLSDRIKIATSKVLETKTKARDSVNGENDSDGDDTPGTVNPFEFNAELKVDMSQDLIDAETNLLDQVKNIDNINLSNKVKILCQILDAASSAGEKTLVFSQSIPTLDYIERLCKLQDRKYYRLDGSTKMALRQQQTKSFNIQQNPVNVFLISTTAGGLGLNLPGANRVVIFDFKFNPVQEEQAIGRAYRIGQKKETFVYRLLAGGTFETGVHNKQIFKQQLASRVVDKKKIQAMAGKVSDFLFEPKDVPQDDLSEFEGVDPLVLDKILESQTTECTIRKIVQSDIFEKDDDVKLTAEEIEEAVKLHRAVVEERKNGTSTVLLGARDNPHQARQTFDASFENVVLSPRPEMEFREVGAAKVAVVRPDVFRPKPSDPQKPTTTTGGQQVAGSRGLSPVMGSNVRVLSPQQSYGEPHSNAFVTPDPQPLPSETNAVSSSVGAKDSVSEKGSAVGNNSSGDVKTSTPSTTQHGGTPSIPSPARSASSSRGRTGLHLARRSSKFPRARVSAAGSPHSHVLSRKAEVSETLSPRLGKGSPQVQVIQRTDMFQAMNRKPTQVQSFKTALTTTSERHHRDHNNKVVERETQKSRIVDPPSLTKSSSSASISSSTRRLPRWADEKLARSKLDGARRQSSQNPMTAFAKDKSKSSPHT